MADCFERMRTVAVLVVLVGSSMFSSPARAEGLGDSPFMDDDSETEATYRDTTRAGVAEYQAGRFQEALSLFRRAHEISPSARTLRGMGMAYFELRDYVAAVRTLSEALQDKRKPLSRKQREDAVDLLERSRAFVAAYRVRLVPDSARLFVDGLEPKVEPDGTILFGFGPHRLEATAPGMLMLTRTIDVQGGERKDLELTLEPLPEASTSQDERSVPDLTTRPAPAKPVINRRALYWFGGAVGGALLATGAAVYWARQATQLDSCRNPTDNLRCTTEDSLVMQRNVGMAATLVTGAAAVTMAVLGWLEWRRYRRTDVQREQAWHCIPGPLGVSCGSSF